MTESDIDAFVSKLRSIYYELKGEHIGKEQTYLQIGLNLHEEYKQFSNGEKNLNVTHFLGKEPKDIVIELVKKLDDIFKLNAYHQLDLGLGKLGTNSSENAQKASNWRKLGDFIKSKFPRGRGRRNQATVVDGVFYNLNEALLPQKDLDVEENQSTGSYDLEALNEKLPEDNLRQAIKDCDFEQIKKLADKGVDINAAYPNGIEEKDVENVFSRIKSLFSEIKDLVVPCEIDKLSMGFPHSDQYQNFVEVRAALKENYNFSEKQPTKIVQDIVTYINMMLSMKSHYPVCRDLKLDKPNIPSTKETKPTLGVLGAFSQRVSTRREARRLSRKKTNNRASGQSASASARR